MTQDAELFYRLVFRGELLEGQHQAVVMKKIGTLLKLDEARLAQLFSGKPVVLKQRADTATAARFQAGFKQAGARLRILPVAEEALDADAAQAPNPAMTPSTAPPPAPSADSTAAGLSIAAPGTDLLRPDERRAPAPVQVSTAHLSLAPAGTDLAPSKVQPSLELDLSHLNLLPQEAVGLEAELPLAEVAEVLEVDWDLAAPGADLGQQKTQVTPALDLAQVNFEVAPAGADLAPARKAPPPAPDTSHIRLQDADD